MDFEYTKLNRNQKYSERLQRLSNLGAFYHNCNEVKFTPSFAIKDKKVFTSTSTFAFKLSAQMLKPFSINMRAIASLSI